MSPFNFKFKFQNLSWICKSLYWESYRTLKVEQLLFLHIFNFYRNFESNLQIWVSGIFVNNSSRPPTAGRHLLLAAGGLWPASRRARGHLLLDVASPGCCVSPRGHPWRTIKPYAVVIVFSSSSVFATVADILSPPAQFAATVRARSNSS
jgi:hypothetical protein